MASLGSKVLETLWRLLPDKCVVLNCCRQGVRGNENLVYGLVMCDYCHAKHAKAEEQANG